MTEPQRLEIRRAATQLVGSEARVYVLLRDLGPGAREIQILAEVAYPLRDRLNVEKRLASLLGNPLPNFKTLVYLADSATSAKTEHRRIRVMGREL
ncbi:MAG: hypothetical protein ACKOD9_07165 [Rubrivivax sp.]